MKQNSDFSMEVLIHGSAAKEYNHNGNTYIEGREGTSFVIKLTNQTNHRVLAVVSVDGLSVINGKYAGYESSGYIIPARDSIKIPGWRVTDNEVAQFEFSSPGDTYAFDKGGQQNLGVIGCAFFKEKQWVFTNYPSYLKHDPEYRFSSFTAQSNTVRCNMVNYMNGEIRSGFSNNHNQNQIGTAFGAKQEHKVSSSDFNSESSPEAVLTIYYDTKDGLRKRGIQVDAAVEVATPFPSETNYCVPPKDWK